MTYMGRIKGPSKQTDTLMKQFIGHIKSISHLEGMKNIIAPETLLCLPEKDAAMSMRHRRILLYLCHAIV
jgi:hypothetical protein